MSNIIEFPLHRVTPCSPWSLSEDERHELAEDYIEMYTQLIYDNLCDQGFDVHSEDLTKDVSFAMEILKSGVLRELHLEHPLQKIQKIFHDLVE